LVSGTLNLLEPGHRVFVNIPQTGYVGVGIVTESAQPVSDFIVDVDGVRKPILEAPLNATNMDRKVDDPESCEYLVRVDWLDTIPVDQAYRETGFFGNRNTACRFRHRATLEKLYQRFDVSDDDEKEIGAGEAAVLPPVSRS